MNYELIAKHFANGKIDRKKWAIEMSSAGPFWSYRLDDLSSDEYDRAVLKMSQKYGESGRNREELLAAIKALKIPAIS